jgi:nucleotide-binding universal stress UspA family protein
MTMTRRTIVYETRHSEHTYAATRVAEHLASCLGTRLVPVSGALRGGRRRVRRLVAVAEREEAVLLIVAVDKPMHLAASLMQSGFRDVIRLASCPVILVPPALPVAEPPLAGDRVLWAVADHSDEGCAALVAALARALDLPVTVAHVLSGETGAVACGEPAAERLLGWFVDGLLNRLAEQDPQLEHRSTVCLTSGDPGSQLRRLGEVEGAAVAVVGCRGRGPLRAAALGSVSAFLAQHGTTPVVVCPPDARRQRTLGDRRGSGPAVGLRRGHHGVQSGEQTERNRDQLSAAQMALEG